jgi:hypothetical protein
MGSEHGSRLPDLLASTGVRYQDLLIPLASDTVARVSCGRVQLVTSLVDIPLSISRNRVWFVALVVVGGAACGQVTPPSVSAAQACMDFAAARCAKRMTCSNGTGVIRAYGDVTTCLQREQLGCANSLIAPATGVSPAQLEACVAALGTSPCADFFDNIPPPACAPHGGRPLGAACAFNGQCASGFCSESRKSACGQCATEPTPGNSCAGTTCGHGQSCVSTPPVCESVNAAGASCDAATPCASGLNCVTPVAATAGTCQAAAEAAGATCGAGTPGCSGVFGLYCGGLTGAKTCMPVTYVRDGMPCGPQADGSRAECQSGTCYVVTSGPAPSGQTSACGAAASDGAACDTSLGPPCLVPARCVTNGTGTTGICTVPDGQACG